MFTFGLLEKCCLSAKASKLLTMTSFSSSGSATYRWGWMPLNWPHTGPYLDGQKDDEERELYCSDQLINNTVLRTGDFPLARCVCDVRKRQQGFFLPFFKCVTSIG